MRFDTTYAAWILALLGLIASVLNRELMYDLNYPAQSKFAWLQGVCLGAQVVVLGNAVFWNRNYLMQYMLPLSALGVVFAVVEWVGGNYATLLGLPTSLWSLLLFVALTALQAVPQRHPEAVPVSRSLMLAAVIAVVATAGSLYYSEYRNFLPCTLCWYQRMMMYPIAVLLTIGNLRKNPEVAQAALPLAVLGMIVGIYHVLEEKAGFNPIKICSPSNPCTTPWVNYFGLVTIPVMSLTAHTAIVVLLGMVLRRSNNKKSSPEAAS